jgi:hypothetical protein
MKDVVVLGGGDQVGRKLGLNFGVHFAIAGVEKLIPARVCPVEERGVVGKHHDAVLFDRNPLAVRLNDSALFEDLSLNVQIGASELRERQFFKDVPLDDTEIAIFWHLLSFQWITLSGQPMLYIRVTTNEGDPLEAISA